MPDWKTIVRDRIAELQLTGTVESDLVEELAQHLQDRYRELCSGGLSEEKALETALSELGNLDLLRVQSARTQVLPTHDLVTPGDSRSGRLVGGLWGDLRYAARTMRKNPAFVVFVVLTLALGIGANTTVFTVINTLILNPLPVPHPSQLVAITSTKVKEISKSSAPVPLSYADLNDLRARNSVFRSFAGYSTPHPMTRQSNNTSQGMFAELVTGNYFSVLELKPFAGRFFLPEEDTAAGQSAVAVMNYGTWRSRFGGNADILGKTLRLNNVVITVIGVAPPDFIGMNAIFGPDLWIPSRMTEQLFPNEMRAALTDRSKALFLGVARLRPPMTRAQAQANIATLAADLAREYPETDQNRSAAVRPIGDVLFGSNSASSTPILFAGIGLLAVVGIVLLIACSNVANLLMARAAARKQEMAVRLALGANRRRLVRQLLTESVLLGSLGGAAGLFVAYAGLHLLFAALPSSSNFIAPKFDTAVFVYALIVSLTTGFLFGAIPALQASDVPVAETLKEEVRTMGRSCHKVSFANALLVGQVAFSFLLLLTASLFLRSIVRAYTLDPGFQTAHLAVFMTSPGQAGYSKARTKAFYKDVSERVEQISGIQSVSWASTYRFGPILPPSSKSRGGRRGRKLIEPPSSSILSISITSKPLAFECSVAASFLASIRRTRFPLSSSTKRWPGMIGPAKTRLANEFGSAEKSNSARLWVLPEPHTIPTGASRRNNALTFPSSRSTQMAWFCTFAPKVAPRGWCLPSNPSYVLRVRK